MQITVITHIEIPGFHKWEQAPDRMEFLRSRHRHIFHIECKFYVHNGDREIEILEKQVMIDDWFKQEFGNMSCEMIAERCLKEFENCCSCNVREDGLGGAEVADEFAWG